MYQVGPLVVCCSAGPFSNCSIKPWDAAIQTLKQHPFCFSKMTYVRKITRHYKALVSVIFMHILMSGKYQHVFFFQCSFRPLSMKWNGHSHVMLRWSLSSQLVVIFVSFLLGVQQASQCARSQITHSMVRLDCIRGLHLKNMREAMIMMIAVIAKKVEAHPLLNITARGLL